MECLARTLLLQGTTHPNSRRLRPPPPTVQHHIHGECARTHRGMAQHHTKLYDDARGVQTDEDTEEEIAIKNAAQLLMSCAAVNRMQ